MSAAGETVSVVGPVFNGSRFLAAALASVAAQSYRPLEVLVVDDGSEDGSADVAARWAEVTVITIEHRGVAAARNAGLARATGAFVAFLDADDLWHPDKTRRQLAVLEAGPDVPGVLCWFRNFLDPVAPSPAWVKAGPFLDERAGRMPSLCTLLARTDALRGIGPFRTDLETGEDLDWFLRAAEAGVHLETLPEILVDRRLHDANLSYRARREGSPLLRVFRDSIARRRRGGLVGDGGSP
jgi:glycosyltransferase involved in cell wall biosynthesis